MCFLVSEVRTHAKLLPAIDNRLERGDEIAPALLEAIEKSKIALVIFSKDYASSTWCLKELVHILECKKSYGQIVIPIFYRIDPSHVRKQKGTYRLEDRPLKRSRDEEANWRAALEEAANMCGFHYSRKTGRTEADFVEEVVQDVLTKLNRKLSSDLKIPFGLVGIEKKIESLLCLDSPGVCCVGIWGMGGIGKTTLAGAVFHRLSSKFEASCFLSIVREKSEQTDGLKQLRNTLVGEILKEKDVNIDTPFIPDHIEDRLRRTKALIVLDDVNDQSQLEDLVGGDVRFCQGSRIIITARDKGLLEQKVGHAKIFNVEGLGSDEALELFHLHAFGNKSPTTEYKKLSREVVDYIKGIPLALKLMGSAFHRCKSKQEWEAEWKKLKQFPIEKMEKVLRISYDGLGKNEKEIFLDIACFFNGYGRTYVKEFLDSRGFFGEAGIRDLIDRSLVSISKEEWSKGEIEMHDLVQDMGRAIAREQRSRLFNAGDVCEVLTNDQGDGHVQVISIDWLEMEKLHLKDANFKKMHQLRWLRVDYRKWHANPLIGSLGLPNSLRYLCWYKYPLKSLPSKFSAQNLVSLHMRSSKVIGAQFWNKEQSPVNLKLINLGFSKHLTEVPNLSRSLNIEHIDLTGCRSLVKIPSYFQHLGKLTYLKLGRCTNLKNLPEMPCNLKFLDIAYCQHLKSLPSKTCELKLSLSLKGCVSFCEFGGLHKDTTVINLSGTLVKKLHPSIGNLVALRKLRLSDCSIQEIPDELFRATSLQKLNLSWSKIKSIPASIKQAAQLSRLILTSCMSLKSLPELPPLLQYLATNGCTSLKTVSSSSTALTQGWEEYMFSLGLHEKHIFSNCPKLDENARSNIMGDAQLRIMRMATASSNFKEDKIEEASYDSNEESLRKRSFVVITCSGNEIPNWFSHKSEGCSIKIELPRDWFSTDFLGFALSIVVVAYKRNVLWNMKIGCKYNFKTSNGESHEVNHPGYNKNTYVGNSHEVFVWWYNNVFEEVVEGAQSPTAFYKLVTEVNVDFTVLTCSGREPIPEVEVEKCGICLLYGKDAEMIKQRAL